MKTVSFVYCYRDENNNKTFAETPVQLDAGMTGDSFLKALAEEAMDGDMFFPALVGLTAYDGEEEDDAAPHEIVGVECHNPPPGNAILATTLFQRFRMANAAGWKAVPEEVAPSPARTAV